MPRKPFPKKRLILVITTLVALLFSLAILHDYSVYQSYAQSSCVITAASVVHISDKKGPSYERSYEFTVSTVDGQMYGSQDFSGYYDTSDEAQADLSQYKVGVMYPCWYNPADPTHAALSHSPFPFGLALLYTLLAFAGYSLFIGVAISIVVYSIIPALYLLVCGQRTAGTVVANVEAGGSRKVRVSYSIADRTDELTLSARSFKIGQTLPVLFDPHGAFKSILRSDAYWTLFVVTPLTLLFLLGPVLTLAYYLWFMVV